MAEIVYKPAGQDKGVEDRKTKQRQKTCFSIPKCYLLKHFTFNYYYNSQQRAFCICIYLQLSLLAIKKKNNSVFHLWGSFCFFIMTCLSETGMLPSIKSMIHLAELASDLQLFSCSCLSLIYKVSRQLFCLCSVLVGSILS